MTSLYFNSRNGFQMMLRNKAKVLSLLSLSIFIAYFLFSSLNKERLKLWVNWAAQKTPIMRQTGKKELTTQTPEKMTYLNGGPPVHGLRLLYANENLCRTKHPLLFFASIFTAPGNFKERQSIRRTWGNPKLFSAIGAKRAFMLGTTQNATLNKLIDKEITEYGDIVQEDFIEAYRNLTFKQVMSLRWISKYCPKVKYVIKIDDDHLLNPFAIVNFLKRLPKSTERSFICERHSEKWQLKVIRDVNDDWYVDPKQYPHAYYKPYCDGGMYIGTRDVINELYDASFHVPFIPNEDAYSTGLLVDKVGHINLIDLPTSTYMEDIEQQLTITPSQVFSLSFQLSGSDHVEVWSTIGNKTRDLVRDAQRLLHEL